MNKNQIELYGFLEHHEVVVKCIITEDEFNTKADILDVSFKEIRDLVNGRLVFFFPTISGEFYRSIKMEIKRDFFQTLFSLDCQEKFLGNVLDSVTFDPNQLVEGDLLVYRESYYPYNASLDELQGAMS